MGRGGGERKGRKRQKRGNKEVGGNMKVKQVMNCGTKILAVLQKHFKI